MGGSSRGPIKRRRALAYPDMPLPQLIIPGMSSDTPRSSLDDTPDGLGDRRKATLVGFIHRISLAEFSTNLEQNLFFKASRGGLHNLQEKSSPISTDLLTTGRRASQVLEGYAPNPIRKFRNRGFEAQLLNREHGHSLISNEQYVACPAADPRSLTASFYSRSCDITTCTAYTGQGNTIPFSLASCHNAPVTAIGDEQGYIRLFNTTTTDAFVENKVDAHVKVHDNAIMGLDFSDDDLRLATACGDRTGSILDVATQTIAAELSGGHHDSLRQIKFQPGQANGYTLATSDRAGRIQIWDLRCSPIPIHSFSTRGPQGVLHRDTTLDCLYAKTINTIDNAHERTVHGSTSSASVTALQWLPPGREHLLLSASEANAVIKLWDTRYIKPRRQAEETPLAVTPEPRGHTWRSYGLTSLALSSDAARLYAVCKDSTVYAYSTSHLMLGQAPELKDDATKRKPHGEQGLGPIFGFKHDMFRAQSFYVKCAIRPATDRTPELLAVGSSDSCAVVFPTDERYMRSSWAQSSHADPSTSFSSALPPLTPGTPSGGSFLGLSCTTPSAANATANSLVPIYRGGTALIRGHSREVTTLSWSHEGKLVTASDDYIVRQWQQDADAAKHLRTVGEFGGERHMAGWADVEADWDVADDD